jgi:hypothetical protein
MTSGKQEGFRVARRTALIDFAEESPWHGVEAKVITSVPFETLFWFQRNANNTDAETSIKALAEFGDNYLTEWNLCDPDGNPYPATGEGVCKVTDSGLISAIMMGWIEAVAHPPANLPARYNGSLSSGEELTDELAKASASLGS